MYTIKVYSDLCLSNEIFERNSIDPYAVIEEIEHDLLDGADWWINDLHEIEEKLSGKWEKAIFIDEARCNWRIISRNYYLGNEESKENCALATSAYLLSEKPISQASTIFSGNLITIQENIDFDSIYQFKIPNTTDNILQNILKLLELCEGEEEFCEKITKRSCLTIVYSPTDSSLTAAKLIDEWESIVRISGYSAFKNLQESVEKLQSINKLEELSFQQGKRLNFMNIDSPEIVRIIELTERVKKDLIYEARRSFFI
jgi:hypothetical protein